MFLYLFLIVYLMSLMSLLTVRKHIFLCLLSLEFIMISLMMAYMYYIMFFSSGVYTLVIMMVMFVCEGVLGLSVLVSMIRCYSNDYVTSMNLW